MVPKGAASPQLWTTDLDLIQKDSCFNKIENVIKKIDLLYLDQRLTTFFLHAYPQMSYEEAFYGIKKKVSVNLKLLKIGVRIDIFHITLGVTRTPGWEPLK